MFASYSIPSVKGMFQMVAMHALITQGWMSPDEVAKTSDAIAEACMASGEPPQPIPESE